MSLVRVIYQDVQGSVVGLVNSNGTVNRYQTNSDPWGITNPWNIALPDTMRLRWQGLFFDGGIANLYYARARWYSPNIKRFLSPDPLGVAAGVNYYTFAGNDPMNAGDPFGLEPCTADEIKAGKGTIPLEGGEWGCQWITNLPEVRTTARNSDWWRSRTLRDLMIAAQSGPNAVRRTAGGFPGVTLHAAQSFGCTLGNVNFAVVFGENGGPSRTGVSLSTSFNLDAPVLGCSGSTQLWWQGTAAPEFSLNIGMHNTRSLSVFLVNDSPVGFAWNYGAQTPGGMPISLTVPLRRMPFVCGYACAKSQ